MSSESVLAGARELAALCKLDLVGAPAAVTWAAEQLSGGETLDSVVSLASESGSADSSTIDGLLADILRDLGDPPMDERRAGWITARLLAEKIAGGSIEPAIGARKIWWDVARKVPSLEPRLRTFIGLGSEWEDDVDNRSEYEHDIVAAANHLLATWQELES